jgi:hypothetical protein
MISNTVVKNSPLDSHKISKGRKNTTVQLLEKQGQKEHNSTTTGKARAERTQ